MGKILVIKGVDFTKVSITKVESIEDINLEEYIGNSYYIDGADTKNVFADKDGRVLYATLNDGGVIDNSQKVIGRTVSDGTSVISLINSYKKSI